MKVIHDNPNTHLCLSDCQSTRALYHLIRGGGLGRLFLDLLLSWIGFALGHFLGVWQGWSLFPLGGLDLGLSIPGD